MKKTLALLLVLVLLSGNVCLTYAQETAKEAQRFGVTVPDAFVPQGGSIVVSSRTGQILWEEDAQTSWVPSSITKLMVIYLTFRAMDQGSFGLDTPVTITREIAELSTYFYISNNKMIEGQTYTVAELFELIFLQSSSAATMALVWQMGYDHGQFVSLMNQTAKDLGMRETIYHNAVGATNAAMGNYPAAGQPLEDQNYTTALDTAILVSHLVEEYPEILQHSSILQKTFKPGTAAEETFESLLKTLEGSDYSFEGADGLKTGSGGASGYNLSMTAKRGDTRMVGILFGVGDWYDYEQPIYRSSMINGIMEKSFEAYEYRLILPKGEIQLDGRRLQTSEDLYDIVLKGQTPTLRLVGDQIQLNLERSYLPGYSAPGVRFVDLEELAAQEQAAAKAKRDDFKDKVSPIVVVLMFIGMLGWSAVQTPKKP